MPNCGRSHEDVHGSAHESVHSSGLLLFAHVQVSLLKLGGSFGNFLFFLLGGGEGGSRRQKGGEGGRAFH